MFLDALHLIQIRKGRCSGDHITNLCWLPEHMRAFHKKISMSFIDFSKAFDFGNHEKLWLTLKGMGVPFQLLYSSCLVDSV